MQINAKAIAFAAAALVCAAAAQATTYSYAGNTTGKPTYNRLFTLTSLSGVGTAVSYEALSFKVSAAGLYAFQSIGAFDNFLTLYGPSFNAATPLVNALELNDDLSGTTGSSGFSFSLLANQTYTLVTTGYANTDFGIYANAITGLGTVTPVPELPTSVLMLMSLAGVALLSRHRSQADDNRL
jgi:hypothetical protein